jgi:hypothetical protein
MTLTIRVSGISLDASTHDSYPSSQRKDSFCDIGVFLISDFFFFTLLEPGA